MRALIALARAHASERKLSPVWIRAANWLGLRGSGCGSGHDTAQKVRAVTSNSFRGSLHYVATPQSAESHAVLALLQRSPAGAGGRTPWRMAVVRAPNFPAAVGSGHCAFFGHCIFSGLLPYFRGAA